MRAAAYFAAGCLAYVLAWTPLCVIVSNVLDASGQNSSVWLNSTNATPGLKLPAGYVVQRAYAPSGIVGFFIFTLCVFSSFGAWHLVSWAVPVASRPRWLPSIEVGYFGLSAVAKTTLYIFLVLTVLAQSSVGRDGQVPGKNNEDDPGQTYAIGFGLSFGVVIPVIWATTACLMKRYKPVYGRQPFFTRPGSWLRWIDYVVSAPIMFAVLSVSWGCSSVAVVAGGVALQAAGIVFAGASDPLMDPASASDVSVQQALQLHRFLAAVHLGSVAIFLAVAAHRNLLGLRVPLRTEWSTEPFNWYRAKQNASSVDRTAVLVMDTAGASVDFPVVLFAAAFATWSGLCHVFGAGTAGGALHMLRTRHTTTTTSSITSLYTMFGTGDTSL